MSEEKKKSGGCCSVIFCILLLLGVILYFGGEETETQLATKTPEDAVKNYVQTVYWFLHNERGKTMGDVFELVPREDKEWFEANYKDLVADPFNIKGGIDPVEGAGAERILALQNVLNGGPTRADVTIHMDKAEISESKAVIPVEQTYRLSDKQTYTTTYEVKLVKIGGYWKVKDFGGGKDNPVFGGFAIGSLGP